MKRTYNFENILKQYEFNDINQLFSFMRKNSVNGVINLSCADLSCADLSCADLSCANLSCADLSCADLSHADLPHANFFYADLSGADLSHADFSSANLLGANLSHANLSGADLSGANLDMSCLALSCNSLHAKFDKRHIIQILYHAAMPTQNNKLDLDEDEEYIDKKCMLDDYYENENNDIIELFNSDLFKKVVNKFHRIGHDCVKFEGVKI